MLDLLFGPRRRAAANDDGWYPVGGGRGRRATRAGVPVDEDVALTYAAVWCATRIIAETAASLPLVLYRRRPDGGREQAAGHPLHGILKTTPNKEMGSMAFREGRTAHQVLYGGGFAEVERAAGRGGEVVALWPIHASRVRPASRQDRDPKLYPYRVRNNDGTETALRADEMLHVPGVLSDDGIWGKGVITYARESVGFGLATERHGAAYFGSGAQPKATLMIPGVKTREARQEFRAEWKEIHNSAEGGEIAILPVEAKYEPISLSNEDSQFLETRKHNVNEIARWFRLPPHMLGDLERATFSNIEQQSAEFVTYSLLPWLKRWEEQICLKLLSEEERREYYVEHRLDALLRGDTQSRYQAYVLALTNGFKTVNEVRALENDNPVEDGDRLFVPLNMTTLERAGAPPEPAAGDPMAAPGAEASEPAPPPALLDVPDFRQDFNYDCGCAATHSVAAYFGTGPATEAEYIQALKTTPEDGTEPEAIIDFLNDQGLVTTSGPGMTLEDLERFFRAGSPVIVPIQDYGTEEEYAANASGHYVVVIGLGLGQVIFQDPSAGRVMMDAAEFDRRWHDMEADGIVDDHFGIAVAAGFGELPGGGEDADGDGGTDGGTGSTDDTPPPGADGTATDPADPYGQNVAAAVREAARAVLVDTLARMFTKESNAAQRAADGGDFDAWLASFYPRHRDTLAAALAPAAAVLAAAGVQTTAETLAGQLVCCSTTELKAAYDADTKPQFKARLAAWPTARAARAADNILAGKHACGGPGSGVPGPCPEGGHDDKEGGGGPKGVPPLSPGAKGRVDHVADNAAKHEHEAVNEVAKAVKMDPKVVHEKLQAAYDKAEVEVNVPHHVMVGGKSVGEHLADGGYLKNQHETKTSQGLVDLKYRDRIESSSFGKETAGLDAHDRPKYGAVNWSGEAKGPAPNYGKAVLVMNKDALRDHLTLAPSDTGNAKAEAMSTAKAPVNSLARNYNALKAAGVVKSPADFPKASPEYNEVHLWGKMPLNKDTVKAIRLPKTVVSEGGKRGNAALEKFAKERGIPVEHY